MTLRLMLLAALALALCGPSPLRGASELRNLVVRRGAEWKAVAETVRRTYDAVAGRTDGVLVRR